MMDTTPPQMVILNHPSQVHPQKGQETYPNRIQRGRCCFRRAIRDQLLSGRVVSTPIDYRRELFAMLSLRYRD